MAGGKAKGGDLADAFHRETDAYWTWLKAYGVVDKIGKRKKAKKMREPLGFLRGSFYFWRTLLETCAPGVLDAPELLGVGDTHIENFGVWRDAEGRLVWGVNDFDDAARLPFASDVTRLACSAALGALPEVSPRKAAKLVVNAYAAALHETPEPFVLENKHPELRDLAAVDGATAIAFWKEPKAETYVEPGDIPTRALELLMGALPTGARVARYYAPLSGTGSLGRQRFAVRAEFRGGLVAREVKAAPPSSLHVGRTDINDPTADYRAIEAGAVRVRDPFLFIDRRWVVRRLSPESHKIERKELGVVANWLKLLEAMGRELANVHLGVARAPAPLTAWMDANGGGCVDAAEAIAEAVQALSEEVEAAPP